MQKGKMIALYGINGIGKTTQAELLVQFLRSHGKMASVLKYPVYELEPEGPFIDKYLRDTEFREYNPRTSDDLQQLYADNRTRYEPVLIQRLNEGEWIVAEDYIGTGIAWGMVWGSDLEYLERINKDARVAEISLLMDGNRFETAIEKGHRNEMDVDRIALCKKAHLFLAEKYDWNKVNAHHSIESVHADIVAFIEKML
jgi:dTMP kinase